MIPNSDWKFCGGGDLRGARSDGHRACRCASASKGGYDADREALSARLHGEGPVRARRRHGRVPRRAVLLPLRGGRTISARRTRSPASIKKAIIRGSSQSGNFTRHFIHLGMNQDEAGRIVHEGAWPLIAGRRVANNSRWGQPDGVLELYQMGSEGPQWWHGFPDRVRDLPPRGILDRCKRDQHLPEDRRDLRRRRSVRAEDDDLLGGHAIRRPTSRCPRTCAATTCRARRTAAATARLNEAPPATGASIARATTGAPGTLRANPVPATRWSTACASPCASG